MKAKIYIGAKKYALYIGRKIVEKTLEFLTLPARFVSNKVQDLKNLTMWGNSQQDGTPTPNTPIPVESVGDRTKNLFNLDDLINAYPTCFEVDKKTGYIKLINWKAELYSTGITVDWKAGSTISFTPISTGTNMSTNARIKLTSSTGSSQTIFITDADGNVNPPQKITVTQNIVKMVFDHTKYNADTWGLENFMVSEEDIPFEPYGYKVPVTVSGKNLFDKDGEITQWYSDSRVIASYMYNATFAIKHIPGTKYYYKHCNVAGGGRYFYTTVENPKLGSECSSMLGQIIISANQVVTVDSIPDEAKWVFFNPGRTEQTATITEQLADYMVTTTPIDENTPYVPYIEPTTTNIYLNEPLRKIDEYSDYIDLESQKVVRNICETKPTSYQKGVLAGSHYRFSTRISNIKIPVSIQDRFLILSDKYIADLTPTSYSETTSQYAITGYTGINQVYIYDKDLDNEQSKTTDIDCLIYYIQETPTEETIDLPTINIPQGDLTLNIDTIVKPSKIEITGDIDNVD